MAEGIKLEGISVYGQVLWTMPLHVDASPDAVSLCPTGQDVAPNAVGWGEQAVLLHPLCCWS